MKIKSVLSYTGVQSSNPPLLIINDHAPTKRNYKNVSIGTFWVNRINGNVWVLTSVANKMALWSLLIPGTGSGTSIFEADVEFATASSNMISVLGGTNLTTSGTGFTITVTLDANVTFDTVIVLDIPPNNVVEVNNSGLLFGSMGSDGTVIIEATAGPPLWRHIVGDSTMTIQEDANGITLIANNSGISQINADTSFIAPDVSGDITISGGSNLTTSASGSTVTIDMDADITLTGTLSGSSLVCDNMDVTGGITFTLPQDNGVFRVDNTGLVSVDNGTDGQVLIGATSGTPQWATILGNGIDITVGPNTINVEFTGPSMMSEPFFISQYGSTTFAGNTTYYYGSKVTLTTEFDPAGILTSPGTGGGNSRANAAEWTAPTTGTYYFGASIQLTNNNGGSPLYYSYSMSFSVDGTLQYSLGWVALDLTFAPSQIGQPFSTILSLSAGDKVYVSLYAYHFNGASFTVTGNSSSAYLSSVVGYQLS